MAEEKEFEPEIVSMRRAFEQAAESYDEAAVLQREIGGRLLERLDYMSIKPLRILDVGAGTGVAMQALAQRYPKAQIFALDIAHNMLRKAKRSLPWLRRFKNRDHFVNADARTLPLADASLDMIFSNLTLQWCSDLDQVFAEFRRVLKPGGMLLFSTFGPDTLKEMRACWSEVDGFTHVNAFIDMHDIGDALIRSRLADPVMDMEMITMTYSDVRSIMHDLKQIGAHNVTRGRARGLTGKGRLQKVIEAYEVYRQECVLPVTYEIIYGHAWMVDSPHREQAGAQEVHIPPMAIKKI